MKHMIKAIPEQTKHGEIFGRDALYLDEIVMPDERHLMLRGEINTYGAGFEKYEIVFSEIIQLSMTTLDLAEVEDEGGSFCTVVQSDVLNHLREKDSAGFVGASYKHYRFQTYDTVFDVVAKKYELNFRST